MISQPILPPMTTGTFISLGQVTYFVTDAAELAWPLVMLYRKGAYLTNIAKLFIETTKEILHR